MKPIQTASVCGLGKLGACIAATLAQRGFTTVGIDIDPEKVRKINAGQAPVDEPLLAETIIAGRTRLRATQDYREAAGTDVTFFIPPSPSLPDGSFSNEFLLRAMQPVAAAVREQGKKGHLVCLHLAHDAGRRGPGVDPDVGAGDRRSLRTRLWRLL